MTIEDDKNVLAAEYVLGTLDADERVLAEELIALDPGFEIIIQIWERRLGELSAMVDAFEPPPDLLARIKAQLPPPPAAPPPVIEAAVPPVIEAPAPPVIEAPAPPAEPVDSPEPVTKATDGAPSLVHEAEKPPAAVEEEPHAVTMEEPPASPEPAATEGAEPAIVAEQAGTVTLAATAPTPEPAQAQAETPVVLFPPPMEPSADIVRLSRRVRRWRGVAAVATVLAATLVALIVVREIAPARLPPPLRPTPIIQRVDVPRDVVRTVEVQVPSPIPAEFVAVLQKDAFSPAFLLTFDLNRRTLTVRAVGAERQAGKSYELWLVSDKYPAPRSLGVIGPDQFTRRPTLAEYDSVTINSATYAVSLEPEGGSPTGAPTEVLYTGKLVQTTPPGFPMQTP